MKDKNIQKKESRAVVLILLFCMIIVLCSAGLFLCYAKERTKGIYYEQSDETWTVTPGDPVDAAYFRFTMELPETGSRRYVLIMGGVTFEGGGLDFTDMNEGQWEYSITGGVWQPLILTNGECVLDKEASPGERRLSIRAADSLNLNAAGGELSFELKLKESPDGRLRIWVPLGAAAGSLTIALMFYTVKKAYNKKNKKGE